MSWGVMFTQVMRLIPPCKQCFWGTSGMGICVRTAPDRKQPPVNLCSVSIEAQNQADIKEMPDSWKEVKVTALGLQEAPQLWQEWVWIEVEAAVSQFAEQDQDLVSGLRANYKAQVKDKVYPVFHSSIPPSGSSCFPSCLLTVPWHGLRVQESPLDSSGIKRAGLIPFPESCICFVCSGLLSGYNVTTLAILLHVGEFPTPHFYR